MALKTFTTADGSANQALVTNGSGVLSFAAVGASAGQVIQVVGATDSTARSTSSTSYAFPSGCLLTVTITPSAAANKILILGSFGIFSSVSGGAYTIFKDSTNLGAGLYNGFGGIQSDGNLFTAMSYLDSPNTTSAITYQIRLANSGAQPITVNTSSIPGSITCLEIKG